MKKYIFVSAILISLIIIPIFTLAAALSQSQINAIVSLLQSFGADQTAISNVETSLKGGTPAVSQSAPSSTVVASTTASTIQSFQSFDENLKYGLKNNSRVKNLQKFLTELGYYKGPIYGNYFTQTQQAVKNFQKANEISPVNGNFGPLTRVAANNKLQEITSGDASISESVSISTASTASTSSLSTVNPTTASIPTVSISANSSSIISGQSVTLTWSSTNTTSCTGTGGNFSTGNSTSGNVSVSPTSNMTYSIACSGSGGSVSKSVSVTVAESMPTVTSISPTLGRSNTTVSIYGTNLSGASSVEFYNSSGQLFGSSIPSLAFATNVVFTINDTFASAPPGTYQVGVVTNACAGGCSSNRISFTLNALTTANNPPVIILKESKNGELFFPFNDPYLDISPNAIIETFYKIYSDTYDFIAIFPQASQSSNYNYTINRSITGIGSDSQIVSNITKNLKSFINMDLYQSYSMGVRVSQTFIDVLIHEIAHYWCCFLQGVISQNSKTLPAHWTFNIDLFSGNLDSNDILGDYHWTINNGKAYCAAGVKRILSSLDLYLMGMLPQEDVSSIQVYDFEPRSDTYQPKLTEGEQTNAFYNLWGPTCNEAHTFTQTRTLKIEDIIAVNGKRNPSYYNEKRDFKIVFVVIVPYGQTTDQDYVETVKSYMKPFLDAWKTNTRNISTMSF